MLVALLSKFNKLNTVKRFYNYKMNPAFECFVAVCQLTCTNNKTNNLKNVKALVAEAAEKRAKVVFLPEACDYLATSSEEAKALAEPLSGPLINEYINLAKKHNVWISVGGFHELCQLNGDTKLFNSHVLIDDIGDIRAVYKKIHLFDVSLPELNVHLKESDTTKAGCQIETPVLTPAGPLGLAICYDLRFPEMSLIQRKLGAAVLTYPSAFTASTGNLHWEVLLRARAIETQCYVVAAAQCGKHNPKRTSFGQAMIIDPQGKILAQCPRYDEDDKTGQSLAIAKIDSDFLYKTRREMPVFEHRRNDVYKLQMCDNEAIPLNDDEAFSFASKIIPGSTVFYKTRYSFAFTNIRCVVPGHVLVSSIRICKRLADLNDEEEADLFRTAIKVQNVVERHFVSSLSSTLCIQDGKYAGQTVPHVHIHVMPRKENDFERNDEIYDRLARHDRDENPEPERNLSEMTDEAKQLRQYFYRN